MDFQNIKYVFLKLVPMSYLLLNDNEYHGFISFTFFNGVYFLRKNREHVGLL